MKTKLNSSMEDFNTTIKNIISRNTNGYWAGDIYYHSYLTALIAIIYNIIGIQDDIWEKKAVKLIEQNQRRNGSWGLVDEELFEHPTITESEAENFFEIKAGVARNTTACLLALKILGGSSESIEMAEEYVKKNIDMKHVDEITQIIFSYLGGGDMNAIKFPPIEIILIPKFFNKSVEKQIPVWCVNSILSALLMKALNSKRFNWSPLKKLSINKVKKLLIKNQLSNGSWYNVTDPTMHSILALYQCGFKKDDETIKKGLNFLKGQINNETGYVHRYWLPVWDTALTLIALEYSDISKDHPAVKSAKSYLLDSMSGNGTWGFCPDGRIFSDCDDTAVSIIALRNLGVEKRRLEPGISWLFEMQNNDGGWSAHMKNHSKKEKGLPKLSSKDPTILLKDFSSADITGHILCAMGKMGYTIDHPQIQKSIKFLKHDQLDSGAWYGRWGLCFTYGTSRVLWGLKSIGEDMNTEYIIKARNWLIEHQNADGGWGEHYLTYFKEDLAGIGVSTPTQTGWALIGLLSFPNPSVDCVNKGIKYLYDTELSDGGWPNTFSVGAIEIYKNTNYDIWPLMAIGSYKKRYTP